MGQQNKKSIQFIHFYCQRVSDLNQSETEILNILIHKCSEAKRQINIIDISDQDHLIVLSSL